MNRRSIPLLLAIAMLLAAGAPVAAPGDQPVKPLPPSTVLADDKERVRTTSLPARGLFTGDKLSESARAQLNALIQGAEGMNVEVALLVPTGPWQIDGSGQAERDLTPARLQAVRRHLAERGVDPGRIFVESRVDARLKEPLLTVQIIGRPATD